MGILVVIVLLSLAGYMSRSAVLVWRDPCRARAEAVGWDKLGERQGWAITRGIVPVTVMFACLALMALTLTAAEICDTARGLLEAAGGVFFVLMLVSLIGLLSIAVFNRPQFLVPPYLRGRRGL
ncbi:MULTISPECIES: hypothetical protein [unclassified Streptomyces]|uniref:hypothetical protein n=1 Tax=unclassified Streptomyces TaxID=2593676 RepID=UPI00087AD452|nr:MULTISPECIES: hypothetical protein [unclassified Streptomyces]REH18404.1 hypothetical protein BX268_0093 [Streptomyces sp. 2221.1]SDS23131.1 hypothetical protein SAMN05428941_0098 [Streptomyces sp. 2114.2]